MKLLNLLLLICCFGCLVSCSDDDNGDPKDVVVDMGLVTNKYLYYNKWQNTKNSYSGEDLVDIVMFDNSGKLFEVDYGGKVETLVGEWTEDKNQLFVNYTNGRHETWNVLECTEGLMQVMVNSGKRDYQVEPDYLQGLTGDAFLLTEVELSGSTSKLRVMLEGSKTVNIKDAQVILGEDQVVPLKYQNKVWTEKQDIDAASLGIPGKQKDVIFYVNIGGKPAKFSDRVYADGLNRVDYDDFALDAKNKDRILEVKWRPFSGNNAYYQVEVFNGIDLNDPYFVSDLLPANTSSINIDNTTKTMEGYSNNMDKLNKKGQTYTVRLSAVLLEPGINYNSKYSYFNRQSVTYVKLITAWN